uniref:Uncharacterized protein n=1 Tax=Romanomermis culicivorax TaxID=13658 RepID=A0A915HPG4_ROMCU
MGNISKSVILKTPIEFSFYSQEDDVLDNKNLGSKEKQALRIRSVNSQMGLSICSSATNNFLRPYRSKQPNKKQLPPSSLTKLCSSSSPNEYIFSLHDDQQPLSLLENPDPYPQRSIIPPLKGLWYCTNNPKNCQYLQCLAENFQYSDQAEKLKAGSKVIADVDLRRTLIHDPNILKIACDKAKLSKFECTNFKMILGLADAIDPAEFHAEDEPRDKRASSDYYDYLDQQIAAKSSMNQTDGQETMKNPRRKKDCEIILRT